MGRYTLSCVKRTQLFGVIAMDWPSEPEDRITAVFTVFTAWRRATTLQQLRPQEGQSSPLDRTPCLQPTLDTPNLGQHRSRHRSRSRHERHGGPHNDANA